jgi:hypothetical protein
LKRYVIWAVIAVSLVLCVILLNRTLADPVILQSGPVGRWMIVPHNSESGCSYLLDTSTGRVWREWGVTGAPRETCWQEDKVIGR